MVLTGRAKTLLDSHLINKKTSYYDLGLNEKSDLVYELLRNQEKADIISECDRDCILPNLIANALLHPNQPTHINRLIEGLFEIFVSGSYKHRPAFYHDIQEYFEERTTIDDESKEHYIQDCIQRAKDVNGELG